MPSAPVEYAGYLVYPDGRVWRPDQVRVRRDGVARRMKGGWHATRIHKGTKGNGGGYVYVDLWIDNAKETWLLHRLVAICHVPNPDNKPDVNHDDGIRTNCRASNLVWATKSENQQHAVRHVHGHHGAAHPAAKLTDEQVRHLRSARRAGMKLVPLAAHYGISFQSASAIARGERYALIG